MKKKLYVTFIVAAIFMVLAQQGIVSANYVLPRITSTPGTFVTLSN